jgi:hypothetical protein
LAIGAQHCNGNREVEARAFFGNLRRRKVHRHATRWKVESCVANCCANAFTCFLDRAVRQSDDGKVRQPICDVRFDDYGNAAEPRRGATHR